MRIENLAVMGAGLVGLNWAVVFASAGRCVVIYDEKEDVLATVNEWFAKLLGDLERNGVVDAADSIMQRIGTTPWQKQTRYSNRRLSDCL